MAQITVQLTDMTRTVSRLRQKGGYRRTIWKYGGLGACLSANLKKQGIFGKYRGVTDTQKKPMDTALMTDDHMTRRNSIHCSPATQHACMYNPTCSTAECGIGWSRNTSHSGNTTSECENKDNNLQDIQNGGVYAISVLGGRIVCYNTAFTLSNWSVAINIIGFH